MRVSKLMLVEDSGILVSDIEDTLDEESMEICSVVSSGEEALTVLEQEAPDLILMDIKLNGDLDGVDTTNQILDDRSVPVVYLTAYSNEKYLDRVRESGAVAFLIKPLNKDDLRKIIRWIDSDRSDDPPELERGEFL